MKQNQFSPSILIILSLSVAYWLYLALNTQMLILYDSLSYKYLGQFIKDNGLINYIQQGPQREPLYPLLIALAMQGQDLFQIHYTKIMAGFGVIILCITQVLMLRILTILNVRDIIKKVILIYMALSPALNNSALSLYSEITTYPLILLIIILSHAAWTHIHHNNFSKYLLSVAGLSVTFTLLTLTKAFFDLIIPFYIGGCICCYFYTKSSPQPQRLKYFIGLICVLLSLFIIPITAYKYANQVLNGSFTITNRGPWALYGNTARRMEPMTPKDYVIALSYTPGEGVCHKLFTKKECNFWSYRKSDKMGLEMLSILNLDKNVSDAQKDKQFIEMSIEKASENIGQYSIFYIFESLKLYFWESTQIGFVQYPPWLRDLYANPLFKDGLRLFVSLCTLLAMIYSGIYALLKRHYTALIMILLFILFASLLSFFYILTRYALIVSPLFLVLIGYTLHHLLPSRSNKIST